MIPPTQYNTPNGDPPDYHRMFLKMANKLRRQRDRYGAVASKLRFSARASGNTEESSNIKLARAVQLDRVVDDLNYMLERARMFATPEDTQAIDNGDYKASSS